MQYPIIDNLIYAYLKNGWTGLETTSRLPSEYQEVEYIESSGVQYIDTGVLPNSNTKIEMSATINQFVGTSNKQIYNARGNNKYYGLSYAQGSKFNHYYGSSFSNVVFASSSPLTINVVQDKNNLNVKINDVELNNARTFSEFVSDYTLYIFVANNAGSLYEPIPSMKLYDFAIWENGEELTRNFIPAINTYNVVGLYDTVTKAFYTTPIGTFTHGDIINGDIDLNDISNRLKLPLPHYFPHAVIDALISASDGQQTEEENEILRHYLTPLGIGGI